MLRQAVWLVVVLSIAVASRAAAQGTTSRVLGVVTDQTGAIVPGATVTLTNEATGVSFNTVTTGAGTYAFEAIQVGTYTLTVELQGFKKFVATGNPVNISEPTTINADVSYAPPLASSSSASGRAIASPTMTRTLTRSSPTRRHIVFGSKRPPGAITILPAPSNIENTSQCALTCMNGCVGSAHSPTS